MGEAKKTNKDRMQEITESIEQGVKDVFNSEKYAAYLKTMSHFHQYSINNTILIHRQKPQATIVAGYKKWITNYERHVKEGERGITIIAPTPYKKKIEEQKLDPITQKPMLDRQGKEIMEVTEIVIPLFKPVKVFDVSQTEGKPLPSIVENLHGNVEHYELFIEALCRTSPVPITFEQLNEEDGYFSIKQQKIAIRLGMSEVQTICALIHEITHAKLHNYEKMRQESLTNNDPKNATKLKSEATEEIEAESVSYVVCQYYGIETGTNSFGYIASWSKEKELSELRDSLETIKLTASSLITDIDKHFQEISKEQGIDLSNGSTFVESIIEDKADQSKALSVESKIQHSAKTFNKYPLPDQTKKIEELSDVGYRENDMWPISQDCARQLFEQGITIYVISDKGEASMVFDREDILTHKGLFAILKSEWEETQVFMETLNNNSNVKDLEEQVKSGKQISLLDLAKVVRSERKDKIQGTMNVVKRRSRKTERDI